jgi:hypothetical protein
MGVIMTIEIETVSIWPFFVCVSIIDIAMVLLFLLRPYHLVAFIFRKIKDIIIDYNFKEIIDITLLDLEF